MNKVKLELLNYIRIILSLIVIFIGLKIFAYSLPEESIQTNIERSITQLEQEGIYPRPFYASDSIAFSGQQLDNWTDAIFLDIAYVQSEIPILKAVAGDFRMRAEGENPLECLINAVQHKQQGDNVELYDYSRQWFGGEVILRPLLLFFTYPQIRILMQVVAMMLLIMGCMSIYSNLGTNATWAYLIGILCINPFTASFSLNLANGFFVMLVSAIAIPKLKNDKWDTKVMLIIGGATAYFDLFVAPFLTYTVCVQLFLIKTLKQKETNWKESFWYLVKISIGWVLGYLLLWSAKWLLASLVLGKNSFQDAFKEMILFSSELKPAWGPETSFGIIKDAIIFNFMNLFPINMIFESSNGLIFFGAIGIICILFRTLKNKSINIDKNYIIYLLASLAPYVWYIVVHVHSFVHYWFQYRLQAGTIIGMIFVYLELTEKRMRSDKLKG